MIVGITYRLTALFLAALMFITSVGFSMDVHYCQDEMRNVSLLGKASSCHEISDDHFCQSETKSCHKPTEQASDADVSHVCESEGSCCHNKSIVIDQLDQVSLIVMDFSPEENLNHYPSFCQIFPPVFITEADFVRTKYINYKPPPIGLDRQVLFQSFLI